MTTMAITAPFKAVWAAMTGWRGKKTDEKTEVKAGATVAAAAAGYKNAGYFVNW